MIAIDWSHTKGLTTFDGRQVKAETLKQVLNHAHKAKDGKEPIIVSESRGLIHSPSVVLEQGCPMSLIYNIVKDGIRVFLIDNHATEAYRKENNIDKTDENDAKILFYLSKNRATLHEITLDSDLLQLHDLYHQYCRFQKARVAMENMKKSHLRQYGISGDSESIYRVQTTDKDYLTPDLSPYDIAIDTLQAREKTLIKKAVKLAGGESIIKNESLIPLHPPAIKGLGDRIWLGIIVTANPSNFKCLSAYLRFCGLTNDVMQSHRYNRHAKMLYHMLAEEIMKQKDPVYRPIYDKCKADIKEKHPDYTKGHIHNAALNRTATFLAKDIFKYYNSGIDGLGGEST